jgi:hypothetical protein
VSDDYKPRSWYMTSAEFADRAVTAYKERLASFGDNFAVAGHPIDVAYDFIGFVEGFAASMVRRGEK